MLPSFLSCKYRMHYHLRRYPLFLHFPLHFPERSLPVRFPLFSDLRWSVSGTPVWWSHRWTVLFHPRWSLHRIPDHIHTYRRCSGSYPVYRSSPRCLHRYGWKLLHCWWISVQCSVCGHWLYQTDDIPENLQSYPSYPVQMRLSDHRHLSSKAPDLSAEQHRSQMSDHLQLEYMHRRWSGSHWVLPNEHCILR